MPRQREFDIHAVLDKAIAVFWAQGYETTSVRDLTSAMGISSSSLYEVFGDKHGVFIAALERYCGFEQARLQAISESSENPTDFVTRMFASLNDIALHSGNTQGSMAFNAMVEFGKRDTAVTEQLLSHFNRIATLITDALARWQTSGQIRNPAPAAALAHLLLNTLIGVVTVTTVEPQYAHRDAITALMLSLLQET
jgi:TetR/AcrR family transcriptional repressor of nem operon